MRNEQIVCDSCGKTWDVIQHGNKMWWERNIRLAYKEETPMAPTDESVTDAEVCSECSNKAMRLLSVVRDFLKGEPLAHEAMNSILEVL